MTPEELHRKYVEESLTDADGYTFIAYIHRRCSCLVKDPDVHERICFDPPEQLSPEPTPPKLSQLQFRNYQAGVQYT